MRRNGADLHRLSPYAPAGTIETLELSRDGRRVVYSGAFETNGRTEVWSVPLAGTPAAAVKLNLPVIGEGVTSSPSATPGPDRLRRGDRVRLGLLDRPGGGSGGGGSERRATLRSGRDALLGFVFGDPSGLSSSSTTPRPQR